MFTKVIASIVLVGALYVAGDAAVKHFGCPFSEDSSSGPSSCCIVSAKAATSDCCAKQAECCSPVSECCSALKTNTKAAQPCCNAAYTYCTQTGLIYEGCCCEIVNGQYRCLITGNISDECCCIPIE